MLICSFLPRVLPDKLEFTTQKQIAEELVALIERKKAESAKRKKSDEEKKRSMSKKR